MTIEQMKQRKKELGYTNRQLSDLSGVPVGTVSKILSGATTCPRYETIQALERILKKDAETCGKSAYGEAGNRADRNSMDRNSIDHNSMDRKSTDYNNVDRNSMDHQSSYDKSTYDAGGIRESNEKQGNRVRESAAAYGNGKKSGYTGYTLEDYLHLPEDSPRKELIDGCFYDMGEPTPLHQIIISFLLNKLTNYVFEKKGECVPLGSPVAVQLDADDKTVVEPDILVVCDRSKFRSGRIIGAPDLVMEVLSPSTRKKDMGLKAYKYQNAGVREYWLVDAKAEQILVYDYEHEAFPVVYGFESQIPVRIWEEKCLIDLKEMKEYISFLN